MKKIILSIPKDRNSNSFMQNKLCKENSFASVLKKITYRFFFHFNRRRKYILTANFIRSSEISMHDL